MKKKREQRFVLCIRNSRYRASLQLRKIYDGVRDQQAEADGLLRIVDETGEDYLYPASYFVPLVLPQSARKALRLAS